MSNPIDITDLIARADGVLDDLPKSDILNDLIEDATRARDVLENIRQMRDVLTSIPPHPVEGSDVKISVTVVAENRGISKCRVPPSLEHDLRVSLAVALTGEIEAVDGAMRGLDLSLTNEEIVERIYNRIADNQLADQLRNASFIGG